MKRIGALAIALCAACAPPAPTTSPPDGVVVSGAGYASDVGAAVLAEGGNAVDAAVATAFALSVVEPTMSGIGGRSQILIRKPDGTVAGLDGTTEVPAGYPAGQESSEDAYGYGTIAIPGTVALLATALKRHGTWPLARVLAPSIRLAGDGFALPPAEAARIAQEAARLNEFEGSRAIFLKADGTAYSAGDRFRQPDLARTLRAIADGGSDAFYHGPIAARMDADMRAGGGWLRADDLARYAPQDAIVVRGNYRGRELIGTYLPASGATVIQALHILEHFELRATAGTAEWVDLVAQALLLAFEDRESVQGTLQEQAASITSKARAAELAARVRLPAAPGSIDAGARRTTAPAAAVRHAEAVEAPFTTHLSVMDASGMAVALTQSVGPNMGSRVATGGLGFLYAATMGYLGDLAPGQRPWSSQAPIIVLENGAPRIVIGGAGARRIISAMVQTLARAIDEELPLQQALAAPRFHVSGRTIFLERHADAAWSEQVEDGLVRAGYEVRPRADAPYFARLNAVFVEPGGAQPAGVPDPRWPGKASRPNRVPSPTGR